MLTFLKILEIVVSILLIAVVLIQNKNVTLNLTSMGGGMGVVTKRGPEKVLQITTIALGTVFILIAILLFILY
ncbi:preprotein translocase subunit SecG [Candidatus Gracilibacteria bacterium]|nr:preprotein translocase subunit SecG [Candidatus Gracilibacteria bacterium]NUJ98606.1 preprotein translocase subunit SecG [Candidatus Gracilibacteria bacterium]